jgi:hypothetical protein
MVNMEVGDDKAGALKVEILDPAYFPIKGHTMNDADALIRTGLDNVVTWKGDPDLSRLAGRAIKLRFHLANSKLFAFRFAQ